MRLRLTFRGHVQHVGLRRTLASEANARGLTGFVVNDDYDPRLAHAEIQGGVNDIREAVEAVRRRCFDEGRSEGFEVDAVEVPQVRGETAFYFM